MSRFFIERPIFSTVLAIVVVIAGLASQQSLPVAQYPEITPPTVRVSTAYPGANAAVVAETVGAPIEQEVNGVEDMIYMSSVSANDGSYALTVTFKVGTDLDMATVLVQNRVAIAQPKLPEEVKRQGVTTKKQSTNIVLIISLTSPNRTHDSLFLSNYATLRLRDELARIDGVGEVTVFGASDYSMRIWLKPNELKARGMIPADVIDALRQQNVQVAAGQIGEPPMPEGQAYQYTVRALGRLVEVEQFENIVVKTGEQGRVTRLKDVAQIEEGAKEYTIRSEFDGRESANIAIYQSPGANALEVADQVEATMERLKANFPEDLEYQIPYNTTLFVRQSIEEVYETLFIAALLVFLTIYVFLQDWRATLIPSITIPVSLIGTFAVMNMLGYSINMLSLFGLILAIGIVVDDAIVVVENTTRHMEDGMERRAATIKAMQEVTGPVIATTLVLLAVFIPSAAMPGMTGQMYRQFAITISAATVFSSINALTLSPALCAIILRVPGSKRSAIEGFLDKIFFDFFNKGLDWFTHGYTATTKWLVRLALISMILYGALVALGVWRLGKLPTGFLPIEDQGYVMVTAQLGDGASLDRTYDVIQDVVDKCQDIEGIKHAVSIIGYSMLDGTKISNSAVVFVTLDPFEERQSTDTSLNSIMANLRREFRQVDDGLVLAFPPPPVPGLGSTGGFTMQVQDQNDFGPAILQNVTDEMVDAGNGQSGLTGLNTTFRANIPQLFVDVDREKALTMKVPLDSVFGTLQAYLGSAYVNDYNKFGRTYQVKVQADQAFRLKPEDIQSLEVRNLDGNMVPLGALVDVRDDFGPQFIVRYNLYPSATINGQAAPGFSSGQGLNLMEGMAESKLPGGMSFEWTGIAYQQKQVGSEAILIFLLGALFVYLVLSAQYESWAMPSAVILAVPLALLGAVLAVELRRMSNDVYVQIGLVLLVAMASKNAILIVEFAAEMRRNGKPIAEAAVEAARLRFRPILMTAFSFILGVAPLVVASGAGAVSRQTLGTAVMGGMFMATVLSIFLVPVFFRIFQGMSESKWLGGSPPEAPVAEEKSVKA